MIYPSTNTFLYDSPSIVFEGALYGSSSGAIVGAISFWLYFAVLSESISQSPRIFSIHLTGGSIFFIGALIGAAIGVLFGAALAYLVQSRKVQEFEESLQPDARLNQLQEENQTNLECVEQWKYQRGEYSKI